ncbi:MAG TPA: hypothetical protein VMI72_18415, partial [Roseiarcus sp.]|nr:hypothetical protein [Roseiarcus sp.]
MTDTLTPVSTEGPWDPGIRSGASPELVPLASIFRPESIFNDVSQVLELHEVTGIDMYPSDRDRLDDGDLHGDSVH